MHSNPVEVLSFFRLLYAIAQILFITTRIIASPVARSRLPDSQKEKNVCEK